MIGKFVKGSNRAVGLLNDRIFTIILLLVGIGAAVVLFPALATDGVTKREAIGIILLVFVPYLIVKGVILILLLSLDIAINFSAKLQYEYNLNYEKAKARVAKIFFDKSIQFSKLDNFEFGIEKYLIVVMQKYLTGTRFNYPTNFISSDPFLVVRIYDKKNGAIQLKVLYEEEKDAEALGRLIVASLQAFTEEEAGKAPETKIQLNAGAIIPPKPEPEKKEQLLLNIPQKSEAKSASSSIIDKFKPKRKKK